MARLEIYYSDEFRQYVLRDPYDRRDYGSYEMVVIAHGPKYYDYHYVRWDDGEWYEVISRTDLKQRIADVEEHECKEVADIWEQEHQYVVLRDDDRVFDLRRKWEALVELELFDIPSTWHRWEGKGLTKETQAKMNAARDKRQREEAEEMAKEYERQALQASLPEGVTVVSLDDPAELHNVINKAVGD